MKKMFKEAHKMTKEIVNKYGVDYKTQFGLCLAYLLENKEEKEVKELKGSEKQIAWAETIKKDMVACLNNWIIAADKTFAEKEMKESSRKNMYLAVDFLKEKLDEIKKEEKATWFIDNKDYITGARITSTEFIDKDYKDINIFSMYNMDPESLLYKFLGGIFKLAQNEYIRLF